MGRKKIIDDETLLGHARAVFLERGAFGTTKDIAQRAGISEALIFQRFPTKAALFFAAMMPPDIEAEAIIATEVEDTRAALVETGHRLLDHFRKIIPAAMHLMTHPAIKMSEIADQFGTRRMAKIGGLLADFLRQKHNQGLLRVDDPPAAANLLIAAIHSLVLFEMMEFHKGHSLDDAVPLFVNALWSGMAPRAQSGETRSRSPLSRARSKDVKNRGSP
jgi:AcrR family transcriptional regulator